MAMYGTRLKLSALIWILFFSSTCLAQEVLRSSVSEEFRGGLQEKYLTYLADKMQMQLSIYPITYAQRIKLLKAGKIDLMIGVKKQYENDDNLLYIKPSYEQLTNQVFIKKSDLSLYQTHDDLRGKTIAFTLDTASMRKQIEAQGIEFMPADFLKQKIELLLKGRVDGFVHFKESSMATIKAMGLEDQIVMAEIAPFSIREHYVVVSEHSPLAAQKEALSTIIERAIANNDFQQLRQQHYQGTR